MDSPQDALPQSPPNAGEVERLADDAAWEAWPSSHDYAERDAFRDGYRAALSTPPAQSGDGGQPYTGSPPPHWDADAKGTHPSSGGEVRYPVAAEEWDYRNDPAGGRAELAERRLRFSYVLADPRAPDQMALVHRIDLGILLTNTIRLRALLDLRRSDTSKAAASGKGEPA